jgi:glucose 1-dehydrogenase
MQVTGQDNNPDAANTDWLGLRAKVCVVTGGGSGIGEATARRFAAAGAKVAVLDRDAASAQRVAADIESAGGRALGLAADVADPEAIQEAAATVERALGRCSILVNNAGVQFPESLLTMDLAKWKRALDVNLTGALVCSQRFAHQMIGLGGGSIVHVGSITGSNPRAGGGAYSSSKAGIAMLARQLAVELGPHGIRSNTVAPGYILTPLSARNYQDPVIAEARTRMVPLGRIGTTQDVADLILFLASERASYLTGQEVLADGGLSQMLMSMAPRPAVPVSSAPQER